MIRSMTAYARADLSKRWGSLSWELRSVNHRYLEAVFRLPEDFRDLEPQLRAALGQKIFRGKVEIQLFARLEDIRAQRYHVDLNRVEALNAMINEVNGVLNNPAHINALEILKWPGVMEPEELDLEPIQEDALTLFEEALQDLLDSRHGEGARLHPLLSDRLDELDRISHRIRDRLPQIIARQTEALRSRIEELGILVDEGRLEQELVLVTQKADVAEELDRLEAHAAEVRDVLRREAPVGRRLDFLMQELNREANTLGSKSLAAETSQLSVDLKVLIEQMREQIQNIE